MTTLIGKIFTWALGNKWGLAATGVIVLIIVGAFKYQASRIDELTADKHALALMCDELTAVNQGQTAVIKEVEAARRAEQGILIERDKELYVLREKYAQIGKSIEQARREDSSLDEYLAAPVHPGVNRLLAGR